MTPFPKSFISLLVVVVVGVSAGSENYSADKNLTADFCYVSSYDQVASTVQSCNRIILQSFEVPAGKTLELKLKKKTVLIFEGTITFGIQNWLGPLMLITGDYIQVSGTANHLLHGRGESYWDGLGENGVVKPQRLMAISSQGGTFKDINIKNCPMFCVAINGHDLTFSGFNIDLQDGFANGLGRNTDGITFSDSSNIVVENSKIYNQDDCVNVLCSSNAIVRNVHCWGSHGFSITSGLSATNEKNDIRNITFEDCSIGGSLGGIHVKTVATGGGGVIDSITYRNIEIQEVTRFAIEVNQDYPNEDGKSSNKIKISNVNLINVSGTVKGGSTRAVRINCGSGSCSSFNWSNVKITGAQNADSCNFQPNGYSC